LSFFIRFGFLLLIPPVVLAGCIEEETKGEIPRKTKPAEGVKLTILYDNNPGDPKLIPAWGFSCLVQLEGIELLFDTGGDWRKLEHNMRELKVDPGRIGIVVLSHVHGDHIGGLKGFLKLNPNVEIWLPESFPPTFKGSILEAGAMVKEVGPDPVEIRTNLFSTGEMGTWIKEQSLVIRLKVGLVVMTGCAHPGIVNIVRRAKERIGGDVYLVIGGFHLGGASDRELNRIISSFKELGVRRVAPCHCSGNRTRELFSRAYGTGYIDAHVGTVIRLP